MTLPRRLPAVLAIVVVAALFAVQPIAAQERAEGGLSTLWEEFPLEQSPGLEQSHPLARGTGIRERAERNTLLPDERPTAGPLVVALVLLAVALGLVGLAGGAREALRARPFLRGR